MDPSEDSTMTRHVMRRSDLIPIVAQAEIGAGAEDEEVVEAATSDIPLVTGVLETLLWFSI